MAKLPKVNNARRSSSSDNARPSSSSSNAPQSSSNNNAPDISRDHGSGGQKVIDSFHASIKKHNTGLFLERIDNSPKKFTLRGSCKLRIKKSDVKKWAVKASAAVTTGGWALEVHGDGTDRNYTLDLTVIPSSGHGHRDTSRKPTVRKSMVQKPEILLPSPNIIPPVPTLNDKQRENLRHNLIAQLKKLSDDPGILYVKDFPEMFNLRKQRIKMIPSEFDK